MKLGEHSMNIEELRARLDQIEASLKTIDESAEGRALEADSQAEWDKLVAEYEETRKRVADYEAREKVRSTWNSRPEAREDEPAPAKRRKTSHVPDNPHDLNEYRMHAVSYEDLSRSMTEGARRIASEMQLAHEDADEDKTRTRLDNLLRRDEENGELARLVITTSSSEYERAFGKAIAGRPLTPEEQRALSTTGSAGGYAVPVTLDPTVILTSAGVNNPIRQLARVETITGSNHWQGVSSAGITASFVAEATEASDGAPTLAQPEVYAEKAHAFVPFSIEIGQDWGSLTSEVARLFADARDTLESSKQLTGLGHGSNEPQGLLVGGTAIVTSAATATLAVADVYSMIEGLHPRYRKRAAITANLAFYDKVRQFDTNGGANMWVQLAYNQPGSLVGYPAYEWSDYSSAVTTSASTIATIGDFSRFLILDRIGTTVEPIQHLFATANNRPTGQRGLYMYWRTSSGVLDVNAFKSLKLL